jgi:hypothetical protein
MSLAAKLKRKGFMSAFEKNHVKPAKTAKRLSRYRKSRYL